MIYNILWWLGAVQIAWWVSRVVDLVRRTWFGTHLSTRRYGEDSWAVVTGSTDGIGLATAKHLAMTGFNIVLISRSIDKLNKCALDIQAIQTVSGKAPKTRVIQLDF